MSEIIIPARLLIETPLANLYNDTINGFSTPRQTSSGRVQVVKKIFVAASRNGNVGVRATTRSSDTKYDTRMFFDGIEFIESADEEVDGDTANTSNTFSFQASDGQDYVIQKVNYNSNDVRVSCNCLDFYYRFSVWNDRDKSLFGKPPPPYVSKGTGAPVNPKKIAGLCKHLIKLTDELRQEQFLG